TAVAADDVHGLCSTPDGVIAGNTSAFGRSGAFPKMCSTPDGVIAGNTSSTGVDPSGKRMGSTPDGVIAGNTPCGGRARLQEPEQGAKELVVVSVDFIEDERRTGERGPRVQPTSVVLDQAQDGIHGTGHDRRGPGVQRLDPGRRVRFSLV